VVVHLVVEESSQTNGGDASKRPRQRRRPITSRETVVVYILRILLLAAILIAWQLVGDESVRTAFFTSKPTSVWKSLVSIIQTNAFWVNVKTTMYETLVGFAIGGVAGVLCGFALAFSNIANRVLDPLLNALNSLPRIALASLFILWFGLGTESKVVLVISLVFFPLFLNALKGATTIDPDYVLLMRTFKASRVSFVRKVILPSTVPWIMSGAKLGIAQALGGAVIGEIISAQHGLGAELNVAAANFDTGEEFAVLLVLVFIAMILNGICGFVERRVSTWR
jgi:NitT/TauT family transport system permease protein